MQQHLAPLRVARIPIEFHTLAASGSSSEEKIKVRPVYALGINAELHLSSSRRSPVGCLRFREVTACGEAVDESV